jgi:hypothetical protein
LDANKLCAVDGDSPWGAQVGWKKMDSETVEGLSLHQDSAKLKKGKGKFIDLL